MTWWLLVLVVVVSSAATNFQDLSMKATVLHPAPQTLAPLWSVLTSPQHLLPLLSFWNEKLCLLSLTQYTLTHTHTHTHTHKKSLPNYGCTHTTFMLITSTYAYITHTKRNTASIATAIEVIFKIPSLILLAHLYINPFTAKNWWRL